MIPKTPTFLIAAMIITACATPQAAPSLAPALTPVLLQLTATPTDVPASATPRATLAPGPRTFTEEFLGGLDYWDFRTIDNGQPAEPPKVMNGLMIFNLPAPNQWAYELYKPQEYADVRVDARVELHLGGGGAAGVICRYGEQGGWYEFDIYPDQTYVLLYGKWLSDGVAGYTLLVQSLSEKIQPVQNDIGLQCAGNVLTPFVNGTQLRRRQETTFGLTSGKIGVAGASFDTAAGTIAFDWVKVSEP